MIKSKNRTLLRTGLELMSMLGHLLEGVVDIEVNSKSNTSNDSIDSTGDDLVKVFSS